MILTLTTFGSFLYFLFTNTWCKRMLALLKYQTYQYYLKEFNLYFNATLRCQHPFKSKLCWILYINCEIDWMINRHFTPYRQYFNHCTGRSTLMPCTFRVSDICITHFVCFWTKQVFMHIKLFPTRISNVTTVYKVANKQRFDNNLLL